MVLPYGGPVVERDLAAGARRAVATSRPCLVRALGRQSYEPVWRAMQALTATRDERSADEIWWLEHDPVFTLGQAGRWEHVLAPGDIPVLAVDRGGQVTYHAPGQLVLYPLLDLRRLGIGPRELVFRLEQAVIDTLREWDITGERRQGAPGVYVQGAKIMALGLRIRRGACYHGIAFNVNMDLEPFSRINPCGFRGLKVTQVLDWGGPGDVAEVARVLLPKLANLFALELQEAPLPPFAR